MELEKYKVAQEIQLQITTKEFQLKQISKLLESKSLNVKITGDYPHRFGNDEVSYVTSNDKLVKELLVQDSDRINNEILELKNKFKEL